jgi:2-amino-4-hydroxy-6-hydroxymethyldihydropteridine diphosphokinase
LAELLFELRCSRVYETEPLHLKNQPDYLNACCTGRTELPPVDLLARLHDLERARGRRRGLRFGPRPLDLDVLLYGDRVIDDPELQVPHPRMHERGFVLVPLRELMPAWRHPILGRTVSELAATMSTGEVTPYEPDPGGQP